MATNTRGGIVVRGKILSLFNPWPDRSNFNQSYQHPMHKDMFGQ
jgi:hypothetical protein